MLPNEYLTKPFAPTELFYHLRRFLLQQSETGSLPEGKQVNTGNDLYNLSLIYEMEDSEYFCEVLKLFLDTTPVILDEIKEGVLYENWDQVYKKAHKLKSSLGILQMNSMLARVAEIEQQAKEQAGTEQIPKTLKEVMEQFNLVRPMIEAELKSALQVND
ncbi:MAG: Hpt domain-containing protein [Chitinophagaceae bacterium]|nr:MAG: Hpt domain-containing protein [Chitinophagaceae bacterium]